MNKSKSVVQAYLLQAAGEISVEKNFVPESLVQMENFTAENFTEIVERASKLQLATVEKILLDSDIQAEVKNGIGKRLYTKFNQV